jgi:anti-sigma B factor antagonist
MSNGNTATILVATVDSTVCVKLEGRANFASSVDFKRLVTDLREAGKEKFVVDLSACQIMDSTFLGMLAGLGMRLSSEDLPPAERPIELLNPSERVADLIDNLGVTNLFHIVHGENTADIQYTAAETEGDKPTKLELSRNCLEAHEILMDLNPDNVAKFKDVAKFFAEEVKRAEGQGA